MPNLYMLCTVVALLCSGLFYFSFPENMASIYGPSNDIDLVEKAYAQQLADVEIMQRQLLESAEQDPTDIAEAPAAGTPLYACDNYNIVEINQCRFAKQLADTGIIYTVFPGSTTTYGVVDVAGSVINHLPQGELPEAVRTKLESYLPTLASCRHVPTGGVAHSPYQLSSDLLEWLERNQ